MQQARSRTAIDAWRPGWDLRLRPPGPLTGRRTGIGSAAAMLMTLLALLALARRRLIRQTAEAVRIDERARLRRDLHDGILQNLAAARLKLRLAGRTAPEPLGARIAEAEAIIASQQARIRRLVEDPPHDDRSAVALGPMLTEQARVVGGQWNCAIKLTVDPPDLAVRRALAEDLTHIIAEATANAVRHGRAAELRADIKDGAAALVVTIVDNGQTEDAGSVVELPRSLAARVGALGGALSVVSGVPGFGLRIALPATRPDR